MHLERCQKSEARASKRDGVTWIFGGAGFPPPPGVVNVDAGTVKSGIPICRVGVRVSGVLDGAGIFGLNLGLLSVCDIFKPQQLEAHFRRNAHRSHYWIELPPLIISLPTKCWFIYGVVHLSPATFNRTLCDTLRLITLLLLHQS